MAKRTLQEIADFFGMALAMDDGGSWWLYTAKPSLANTRWYGNGNILCRLSSDLVDYSGDWRDSLTLPESWTKEPPFKDGELVFNSRYNSLMVWRDCYDNEVAAVCSRPTEAEWAVLRGEG